MKLISIIFLLFSINTFAADEIKNCKVVSKKYPELTRGENQRSLCRETLYAMYGSMSPLNDKRLVLKVIGRTTYSVRMKISVKKGYLTLSSQLGTMHWYPGDEYVILD